MQYDYNHKIDPINFGVQDHPEIAGKGDTIGIVWQDNRNSYMDCFFSYSTTGAYNLSGSVVMNDTNNIGSQTAPDICFSNGTFHFVYVNVGVHEILYRTATFASSTAVSEIEKNIIAIYPNPATDKIKITTELMGDLIIKDLEGKKILSLTKENPRKQIDISFLPIGIYTIEIKGLTSKFIKQ